MLHAQSCTSIIAAGLYELDTIGCVSLLLRAEVVLKWVCTTQNKNIK